MVMEDDIKMLEAEGVDLVFVPSHQAVYPIPDHLFPIRCNARGIDNIEGEGLQRPGFFEGVATVVSKLFAWVRPAYAMFGQKDFQQTIVVRSLCQEIFKDITVVVHPTIREVDGLPFASRNKRLTTDERHAAPQEFQLLSHVVKLFNQGERSVERLLAAGRFFASSNAMALKYLTLHDWFAGVVFKRGELCSSGRYCLTVGVQMSDSCSIVDNMVFGDVDDLRGLSPDGLLLASAGLSVRPLPAGHADLLARSPVASSCAAESFHPVGKGGRLAWGVYHHMAKSCKHWPGAESSQLSTAQANQSEFVGLVMTSFPDAPNDGRCDTSQPAARTGEVLVKDVAVDDFINDRIVKHIVLECIRQTAVTLAPSKGVGALVHNQPIAWRLDAPLFYQKRPHAIPPLERPLWDATASDKTKGHTTN
eukprot:GHVT01044985.1.p1 GENE.GHVT01044985.1~~GHVT01044985.1.p1  ORF type:complete len:420 (+),score=65.68 GHVT01044985.1:196-1455(+)